MRVVLFMAMSNRIPFQKPYTGRLLIFNEIEKIEVAVRSAIVNIGCDMTGNPFWMTDGSNFIDAGKFRLPIY